MLSLKDLFLGVMYFFIKCIWKFALALPVFIAHFIAESEGILSTVKSLKKKKKKKSLLYSFHGFAPILNYLFCYPHTKIETP